MAVALVVGTLLLYLGFLTAFAIVALLGGALILVGQGAIGLMVLRESDADWEHTPRYKGFRPLAGAR